MNNNLLVRFWFQFVGEIHVDLPSGLILGCGVTAYSKEDALNIIRDKIFNGKEIPLIKFCKENIDISTLDKGHVLPNMGIIIERGIWFPLGYR